MYICPRPSFCDCDSYKKQMRTQENSELDQAKDFMGWNALAQH